MKAEDVPPPWTDAARSAYEDAWEQGHPPYRSMMHAITAVAPLIAKAERERITEDLRRMSGGHVAHECALIHRVIERIESAAMPTVAATVET